MMPHWSCLTLEYVESRGIRIGFFANASTLLSDFETNSIPSALLNGHDETYIDLVNMKA